MAAELIHRFIVCQNHTTLVPESIVESLMRAGHAAELTAVRRLGRSALVFEIALGNSRSRVFIDASEDFAQFSDFSTH